MDGELLDATKRADSFGALDSINEREVTRKAFVGMTGDMLVQNRFYQSQIRFGSSVFIFQSPENWSHTAFAF